MNLFTWMDKNSINIRFVECVNHVLTTINDVSKGDISNAMGVKANTFSEILNMRMNIATDHIANFIMNYPFFSAEWILTGNGQMINQKTSREDLVTNKYDLNEIIDLARQLGMQIKENEYLHQQNMNLAAENARLKKDFEDKRNPYSHSVAAEP